MTTEGVHTYVTMLIIVAIATALMIPCIQSNNQTCHIKNAGCLRSVVPPCYNWLNVTKYFSHCIEVCKVLLFSPGIYFLNATLIASNDRSISFIGASATTTNIVCLEQRSLFTAVNISTLKMVNISWTNCGGTFEDMHMNISKSYTTLLLHNVTSAEFYNVIFNSSQGYTLFGVNLHIKLFLINISIFNKTSLSPTDHSKGIMILNLLANTSTVQLQACFIMINDRKFYMFSNKDDSKDYTKEYLSIHYVEATIGIVFHQRVIINTLNTWFVNIVPNNIPVVSISYLINKPSFVIIINSTFKNVSYTNSLLEIKFLVQPKDSSVYPLHIFSFQNCTFSHNKVIQLMQISQSGTTVSFSAPIKVEIHTVNNLFDTNKAIGAIWKVNLNSNLPNTSVLIIDCGFLCNNVSEPALRFEDIYSLLLNERNTFVNNCAKVQIYLSCLARFNLQGNATFSNNRVKVLLYLSNYKMLNVNYTLLNISSNERVKVNDILQQCKCCFIYMLPNMSSSEACAFRISQCVKNMASLRTQNVFQNKRGYQGVIKKYPFNNCKWDLNCNQHVLSNIFEVIAYFDKSNSAGRENGICYCEHNSNYTANCSKTKLDITIYPGQTIILPLVTAEFNSSVSVTSYDEEGTSVCPSVYNNNTCSPPQQLNIVYETCTTYLSRFTCAMVVGVFY